jgi:nitroreductase
VDLFEAIERRKTTNGAFLPDAVRAEDQRRLVEAAARAPSHFNSQPWRFVLVDDRAKIERVAAVSRDSMRQLMEEGTFWKRYRRYFRFTKAEMERTRTGMYFDKLPAVVRPFAEQVFTERGQRLMRRLGVPETLAEDNYRIVAGSPLLLCVLLDRAEYLPGELSGFYSVFGMGAAVENVWLATAALGMGIQFVSTPMEIPERWRELERLFEVPGDLALMAIYRLGYVPPDGDGAARRNRIDWTSRERRAIPQFVFRNSCSQPEDG